MKASYQVLNSSSPRPIKNHSNSMRNNCQKTCSWSRRPETKLKSDKRPRFSRWSTGLLKTSFLLTTERRLTGWRFYAIDLSPQHSQTRGLQMTSFNSLQNKVPSDRYWRVQLECMKIQAHTSWEPAQEYQDHMSLTNEGWLWTSERTRVLHKDYAVSY